MTAAKAPLRLLFHCEASEQIGLGHLTRCAALAQQIDILSPTTKIFFLLSECKVSRGSTTRMLSATSIIHHAQNEYPGFHFIDQTSKPIHELAESKGFEGVILDGYYFSAEEDRLWAAYGELLRFDDGLLTDKQQNYTSSASVILNSAPNASLEDYASFQGDLWIGPPYHPIRQAFRPNLMAALTPDNKVLLMFGGSDPQELTLSTLKQLHNLVPLRVICGPGMSSLQRALVASFCQANSIEWHYAPQNLSTLMATSRAAITAAGSTIFELAALQVPFIAVQVADNQSPIVIWLAQQQVEVIDTNQLDLLPSLVQGNSFKTVNLLPGRKLSSALKRWLLRLSSPSCL